MLSAEQLRRGDRTVAAIAGEVDYLNPFAFTNAFERRYGVSPSAYRGAG